MICSSLRKVRITKRETDEYRGNRRRRRSGGGGAGRAEPQLSAVAGTGRVRRRGGRRRPAAAALGVVADRRRGVGQPLAQPYRLAPLAARLRRLLAAQPPLRFDLDLRL